MDSPGKWRVQENRECRKMERACAQSGDSDSVLVAMH